MIATAVVSAENVFDTEIQVFDYLVDEQICSFSLEGNFPIACVIESNGLTVIGNKYTAFYSINGDYISRYPYDIPPVDFSVNKSSIQLLFKEEGFDIEYRSVALNEDGGLKYEWTISSTVFDAEVYGNWTYCLIEGYLLATDGEHFYEIYVEGVNGNSKLLSFDEGIVYVCTDNASPLYFIP